MPAAATSNGGVRVSEGSATGIDPRFDPRFQRGYVPDAAAAPQVTDAAAAPLDVGPVPDRDDGPAEAVRARHPRIRGGTRARILRSHGRQRIDRRAHRPAQPRSRRHRPTTRSPTPTPSRHPTAGPRRRTCPPRTSTSAPPAGCGSRWAPASPSSSSARWPSGCRPPTPRTTSAGCARGSTRPSAW